MDYWNLNDFLRLTLTVIFWKTKILLGKLEWRDWFNSTTSSKWPFNFMLWKCLLCLFPRFLKVKHLIYYLLCTLSLEKEVLGLTEKVDKRSSLIDRQEQYSRRNWILIHGIKENQNENSDEVVMNKIKKWNGFRYFSRRYWSHT